ncbi:MAG: BACON domain-containing protein, partial [Candidatus Solibacter sp.]
TVAENLPPGLVLISMSGTGWTCAANSCTRADSLAGGASYPVISVNVSVAVNAGSPQVNSVSVSGGGSPPATATDSTALSCSFQLTGGNTFSRFAATGSASISTTASCSWTASVGATWLHITSTASGSGSAQLSYSVDANVSATQRTATITAGSASLTVYQGGNVIQSGPGLRFVPSTPCRIADTRIGTGPYGGPAVGPTPRDFSVTASACGIPATAQAYSLNLTVVPSGTLGALYVWPTGQVQPGVPNLSSTDARVKADMAIVAAGINGSISIAASQTTNVVVDINGYFVPASGASDLAFYPVTPCRLVDTRIGTGALAGPAIVASQNRTFPVLSSPCNIPAAARAYALNVTVIPSSSFGFLSIWPAGNPQPVVSTLNAPTGAVTANAAIVPSGDNGAITVIASHSAALILDINGYFAPPGPGGLQFYPQTPCRIADTRDAAGAFGGPQMSASAQRDFLVTASACGVPLTAAAYSLNASVLPPAALGFLSLWGAGGQPTVSTLNAYDGATMMNTALVPVGAGGVISAFTSNLTHLLLDINGYFAP